MFPTQLVLEFFQHKRTPQLLLLLCSACDPRLLTQLARSGLAVAAVLVGPHGTVTPGLFPRLPTTRTGVVVDAVCAPRLLTALEEEGRLWTSGYTWLVLANGSSGWAPGRSGAAREATVAWRDRRRSGWVLADLGRVPSTATWSPEAGLQQLFPGGLRPRRLNLSVSVPNFGRGRRYHFDQSVLQTLAEFLNFRLQVETPGSEEVTSEDLEFWSLRTLQDVGPTTVAVTPHTLRLARFSVAVGAFRPRLLYWRHSANLQRNVYVLPFSGGVWTFLCCVLVTITVALTFILGREGRLERAVHSQDKRYQQPPWDLTEVMLVTIGAICQQGCARDPVTLAARILFIVSFLLAVVTYTSYSAGVISIMSSAGPAGGTLQAVLGLRTALHDTLYFRTHFKLENNAVSRQLAKRNRTPPSYLEMSAGLQHVLQGTAAFCADREDAYAQLHDSGQSQDRLCGVGEVALLQGSAYQRAFPIRRDYPYTDDINQGLVRMLEHGLVSRERHRWLRRGGQALCGAVDYAAASRFSSVTLADFRPTLKLLGCGVVSSLLVLSAEFLTRYCSFYWKGRTIMKKEQRPKFLDMYITTKMCTSEKKQKELPHKSTSNEGGNLPFIH